MSDTPPTTDETPDLPFPEDGRDADAIPPVATPAPGADAGEGTSRNTTGGGLEKIVTRLDDDRPPKWAMNWRPIDEEGAEEATRDHHPARIAGQEDESSPTSEHAAVPATTAGRPGTVTSGPASSGPTSGPTSGSTSGSTSSGSPSAESSRADRHPKAPRADATGRVLIETPTGPRVPDDRSGTGVGRVLAGWLVALGIGLAWLATTVGSESESPPTSEASGDGEARRMLARPLAPAEPDPSPLLLQEIATLQEERADLLAELDAAAILMTDHQRLSHELDRTARRWRTATEQLQFLDESLEAAIIERARLATELAIVHRMLDEARDSD